METTDALVTMAERRNNCVTENVTGATGIDDVEDESTDMLHSMNTYDRQARRGLGFVTETENIIPHSEGTWTRFDVGNISKAEWEGNTIRNSKNVPNRYSAERFAQNDDTIPHSISTLNEYVLRVAAETAGVDEAIPCTDAQNKYSVGITAKTDATSVRIDGHSNSAQNKYAVLEDTEHASMSNTTTVGVTAKTDATSVRIDGHSTSAQNKYAVLEDTEHASMSNTTTLGVTAKTDATSVRIDGHPTSAQNKYAVWEDTENASMSNTIISQSTHSDIVGSTCLLSTSAQNKYSVGNIAGTYSIDGSVSQPTNEQNKHALKTGSKEDTIPHSKSVRKKHASRTGRQNKTVPHCTSAENKHVGTILQAISAQSNHTVRNESRDDDTAHYTSARNKYAVQDVVESMGKTVPHSASAHNKHIVKNRFPADVDETESTYENTPDSAQMDLLGKGL